SQQTARRRPSPLCAQASSWSSVLSGEAPASFSLKARANGELEELRLVGFLLQEGVRDVGAQRTEGGSPDDAKANRGAQSSRVEHLAFLIGVFVIIAQTQA